MCSLAHTIVQVMRKVVIILVGSAMVLWKSDMARELVDGMVLAVPYSVHSRMKHTCEATISNVQGWSIGPTSSQLQCTVAYGIVGKNTYVKIVGIIERSICETSRIFRNVSETIIILANSFVQIFCLLLIC